LQPVYGQDVYLKKKRGPGVLMSRTIPRSAELDPLFEEGLAFLKQFGMSCLEGFCHCMGHGGVRKGS